jgi:drug/metabolite transporter (DMT)-like permease
LEEPRFTAKEQVACVCTPADAHDAADVVNPNGAGMQSLFLGLTAALLWGMHDFILRRLGTRVDALPMLFVSLVSGIILLGTVTAIDGGFNILTTDTILMALAAGFFYALGCLALYRAFAIGPVRLVAPLCGSYPALSILFAIYGGNAVTVSVWASVAVIIAGIALVARGEKDSPSGKVGIAVLWSGCAALGFALTFAFAQTSAGQGDALAASSVTRFGAILVIGALLLARRAALGPAKSIWRTLVVMGAIDVTAMTLVALAGRFPNPEIAAITSSIFGLITILLAMVFLGEKVRPVQWLGVLAVFGGVVVLGMG